jgi:6-oxo-cyclohex-1-ene-carbonyl-CoA hydrolase
MRLGLLTEVVAVHRRTDGSFAPNPLVVTDRYADDAGRIAYGEWKTGAALEAAKIEAKACTVDLAPLDLAVERLATKLLYTFPDCTRKTLESLRKKKLEHWFQNAETSRSWLSLNMTTEAAAGFAAFHYGDRSEREIDFVRLRTRLAEGAVFDDRLVDEVLPASARARRASERRGAT